VATGEGTSRLTDGQIVTVDGNAGVVRTAQLHEGISDRARRL